MGCVVAVVLLKFKVGGAFYVERDVFPLGDYSGNARFYCLISVGIPNVA